MGSATRFVSICSIGKLLLFFDRHFEPFVLLVKMYHRVLVSLDRNTVELFFKIFLEDLKLVLDNLLLSLESFQRLDRGLFLVRIRV